MRSGPISHLRVIAKKLYGIRFVTCASPRYLKKHGTPAAAEKLAEHECLPYWMPPLGRHLDCVFERKGARFTCRPGIFSTRIQAFLDFLAVVVPEEPGWDRAVPGKGPG